MSSLTLCNYCTLNQIKSNAEKRGATVTVGQEKESEYWTVVRVSDKDKPVAYFLELTTHCVC